MGINCLEKYRDHLNYLCYNSFCFEYYWHMPSTEVQLSRQDSLGYVERRVNFQTFFPVFCRQLFIYVNHTYIYITFLYNNIFALFIFVLSNITFGYFAVSVDRSSFSQRRKTDQRHILNFFFANVFLFSKTIMCRRCFSNL